MCLSQVKAGVIVLDGKYQGKNLYVRNSFASSGVGFCVMEVKVNGSTTTDEWNSSAFEIDFSSQELKIGDPVHVEIRHKDACKSSVKVLNPEVLEPTSTFEIQSIDVDRTGKLTWTTTNEMGKLPFIVEQYRWNKWVKVGEVMGKGNGTASYEVMIRPHSGPNRIRVKQIDHSGPRYSQDVKFRSIEPELDFAPKRVEDEIVFSDSDGNLVKTMYEIFDEYGNLRKKGFASKVNVANLKKGIYYINFDSKDSQFIKK